MADIQAKRDIAASHLQAEQLIHANDAAKIENDARKTAHDEASARASHGIETARFAADFVHQQHERQRDHAQHAEQVIQGAHDRVMAEKEHGLAVKESNKPQPKPKASK